MSVVGFQGDIVGSSYKSALHFGISRKGVMGVGSYGVVLGVYAAPWPEEGYWVTVFALNASYQDDIYTMMPFEKIFVLNESGEMEQVFACKCGFHTQGSDPPAIGVRRV